MGWMTGENCFPMGVQGGLFREVTSSIRGGRVRSQASRNSILLAFPSGLSVLNAVKEHS